MTGGFLSVERPLNVGKARTAFLARQGRGLLEVFLQPGHVRPMRGGHVLQVKELNLIGRRIHLPGQKMRVRRNVDAGFGQPFSDVHVVRHHREDPRVGFPFIAAARAAVQRRFVRIVVRRAAVRAKQDQPRKVLGQTHHAQRRVDRQYLFFLREARAGEPLLVAGRRAGVEVVVAAQRLDQIVQRVFQQARLEGGVHQRRVRIARTVQRPLPQRFHEHGRDR